MEIDSIMPRSIKLHSKKNSKLSKQQKIGLFFQTEKQRVKN